MNLNQAVDKIYTSFEETGYDANRLKTVMEEMEEGHVFIKSLYRDLNFLQYLKRDKRFGGYIHEDGRGWLTYHNFPLTLQILNKEKVPGRKVVIRQMGGKKMPMVIYYALCPELENFVSLINWVQSKSSRNAYQKILELINNQDIDKVLQFSNKCGIRLPNEIHPGNDKEAKLITKELFESLYDWKLAHYLFDDGMTVLSHNSPVNYRQVYLDEFELEKAVVDIRTTIGRITSISSNKLTVLVPCLFGKPYEIEFYIDKKFPQQEVSEGNLYFLHILNRTATQNLEKEVRKVYKASTYDLLGMFMAVSCYLLYLGTSRLKILNDALFEKLFVHFYQQTSRFCSGHGEEMDALHNMNWKLIQLGYTSAFTKWINKFLFYTPPVLRQFLTSLQDPRLRDYLVVEFDKALEEQRSECFEKIPYDEKGMRMFSAIQLAQYNRLYSFIFFLLEEKKFILGFSKGDVYHKREEEYKQLKNMLNLDIRII